MKAKRQVLLVDDHPLIREGLAHRIHRQPDLEVCGGAATADEALGMIAASQPDLVVVDLVLKDGNGLDLIHDIRRRWPDLAIVVLSMQDENLYAPRALAAGARGYVKKGEAAETIVDAIRCVLDGNVWLSEAMKMRVLSDLGDGGPKPRRPPIEALSNRELEVYRLLGEGLETRQIASRLHLSFKTVESYYDRIKIRLKIESFRDLVRHATLFSGRPVTESPSDKTPRTKKR